MNAVPAISDADLHIAFEQFNQISSQLAHAYQDLESRFRQIKSELSDTKARRLLELAEKERLARRMHLLLMALPMGVIVLDQAGIIQQCNQAALALLATPLQGLAWQQVIDQLFSKASQKDINNIRVNGRNLHFSSKTIADSKDSLILVNDVTDSVAHLDSVKRKQRLAFLGKAIASIAHDIRTPLAAAFLNLSSLNKKLANQGQAEHIEAVAKVKYNLKALENTINSMLMYARGAADTFELINCKTCCELLAKDLLAIFPNISFNIHTHKSLGNKYIKANFDALTTLFRNLIANSKTACAGRLIVDIEFALASHSRLSIAVSDNGPGIQEEVLDKIFDAFFTTRKNGTGLGLSIVKSIIESHQGHIHAGNVPAGAVFYIDLPIQQPAAEIQAASRT